MDQSLKNYYLNALGIEPWELQNQQNNIKKLFSLEQKVKACSLCSLSQSRTNTVFSRGNAQSSILIIGEAPGFYEDKAGEPFVGKAGQLLDLMLKSINLSQTDVYITNILKCRPPNNRDPSAEEISQCTPYLREQIQCINPKLMITLGRFSGSFLLGRTASVKELRRGLNYYDSIPFFATYHPAYLLRNPADKKLAYQDLLKIRQFIHENIKAYRV